MYGYFHNMFYNLVSNNAFLNFRPFPDSAADVVITRSAQRNARRTQSVGARDSRGYSSA
jgi:hypothetical protein